VVCVLSKKALVRVRRGFFTEGVYLLFYTNRIQFGIFGYFKKTKYYQYYDIVTGSSTGLNFSTKDIGFNMGQTWLSSLGFTYHF
jgi:hypothetical protein